MYPINRIHRSALGLSATCSHLRIAQNTMAVKKDDIAYTSPSTAENQNESAKPLANAPTIPAPINTIISAVLISSSLFPIIFLPSAVTVQNKNKLVNADDIPARKLTDKATLEGSGASKV